MDKLKKSLNKKITEFENASKKLQQTNLNSVGQKKYNATVSEVNSIKTEIDVLSLKLDKMESEAGDNLAVSDYFQKLNQFQNEINEKFQSPELDNDRRLYLENLQSQLKEFQNDFSSSEIQAAGKKGRNTILNVTVNDRATGRFLLDTGATHMVFSSAFASLLGLNLTSAKSIKSLLADGRTVNAKPVVLQKVKVGNAVEKNVEAIVLPDSPGKGIDGLLGMTFLSNYMVQLDPKNNKLTLNKLK